MSARRGSTVSGSDHSLAFARFSGSGPSGLEALPSLAYLAREMAKRLQQLELTGRGAMAEVYRGVLLGERGTRRQVAVKRLRPELRDDPEAVELFVREAKLAVALDHPKVVHALELGRDDQGYYLVCEWVDGVPLAEFCARHGPLPVAAVIDAGDGVCAALTYLHGRHETIHRDVTPGNIFVTTRGEVKLGDFGVAVGNEESTGVKAGTPGFSAPEQTDGERLDARADLYGLGRTLMTVGGASSPALKEVLKRVCAESVEDRYPDARAFAAALGEVAQQDDGWTGEPTLQQWVTQCGGVHAQAPQRPQLDGAVKSILGPALAANEGQRHGVSPARRGSSWPFAVAAVGIAALGGWYTWSQADPPASQQAQVQAMAPELPPQEVAQPPPVQSESNPLAPEPTASPPQPERVRHSGTVVSVSEGVVHLNSVPWARVEVDGIAKGSTPLRGLRLRSGKRRVRLVHPPSKTERSVVLEVTADRTQTFVIDLRAGSAEKRVE